jgi:lipid-A-disaccharide synthase
VKLLISAAEASADLHSAQLIRAFKRRVSDLYSFGIGGKNLEAEGMDILARAEDLAVMGSIEILSRLSKIRQAERELLRQASEKRPDVAILVDYPGFHFRVGPRLHAMGIPVIYYIPPKVWVWRKKRLNSMKKWVSQVLCILPFEPKLYHEAGISAEYVGSPLVEELPLSISKLEARNALGLHPEDHVLVIMPGIVMSF